MSRALMADIRYRITIDEDCADTSSQLYPRGICQVMHDLLYIGRLAPDAWGPIGWVIEEEQPGGAVTEVLSRY